MNETQDPSTGVWVPSAPEPLWVGLGLWTAECGDCGARFAPRLGRGPKPRERYGTHYRAEHGTIVVVPASEGLRAETSLDYRSIPGSGL